MQEEAVGAIAQFLEFGGFSLLRLNEKKSFALLKRQTKAGPLMHVGLLVKDKVRYTGVQIGHVIAEEAYAP